MGKTKISLFEKFKRAMEKTPTMKKWGIISWIATISLTVLFVIYVFFGPTGADTTSFATVVGLSWGEVAVYNACYCFKERAENRMKISLSFINQLADKYGIEAITPIIQSIIQE